MFGKDGRNIGSGPMDRDLGFGDNAATALPGTTVRVSEGFSGPGIATRTVEISAPGGVGNYNPPAVALVETTGINGQRTTQTVPIGGSYGASQVTYETGTLSATGALGVTEITVVPNSVFPTDMNVKNPIPGTIGNVLAVVGRVNVGIDSVTGIPAFTVSPISTEFTPISLSANYPPGYLESLGINPNNLPSGIVGQFDPDGHLIGLERVECFGPDTPIDMWPLEPEFAPDPSNPHKVFDQDAVRAKIWKKPIAMIRKGDIVVSFDENDNLMPGRVSRTFENESKILLDYFGTRVTPGHVYFRPDSKKADKFECLLDILRDDGMIQNVEGKSIRAATNMLVDDPRDGFVWAITQERKDGILVEKERGRVRLGTRFIVDSKTSQCVADVIEARGGIVGEDELIRFGDGEPEPFVWEHSATLPKPETFVLEASGTTLEDIYKAGEWESRHPQMPAPMVLDGGPVQPLSARELAMMPRNQPLNLDPVPSLNRAGQPTLNRKQRKAAEAKQRKAAKARKRLAG